jgi:hypothetical protein
MDPNYILAINIILVLLVLYYVYKSYWPATNDRPLQVVMRKVKRPELPSNEDKKPIIDYQPEKPIPEAALQSYMSNYLDDDGMPTLRDQTMTELPEQKPRTYGNDEIIIGNYQEKQAAWQNLALPDVDEYH